LGAGQTFAQWTGYSNGTSAMPRGVQVWAEADRAGCSSVVITVSDLDAVADHLKAVGLTDATPTEATSSRVLPVEDPDGNRIVFAGG
jgi:hypothetical protein